MNVFNCVVCILIPGYKLDTVFSLERFKIHDSGSARGPSPTFQQKIGNPSIIIVC